MILSRFPHPPKCVMPDVRLLLGNAQQLHCMIAILYATALLHFLSLTTRFSTIFFLRSPGAYRFLVFISFIQTEIYILHSIICSFSIAIACNSLPLRKILRREIYNSSLFSGISPSSVPTECFNRYNCHWIGLSLASFFI